MAFHTQALRVPSGTFTRGIATSRYIHIPPRPLPPRVLPFQTLISGPPRFQPLASLVSHYNRNVTKRRYINDSPFHASAARWMVHSTSTLAETIHSSNVVSNAPAFWQSLSEFNQGIRNVQMDNLAGTSTPKSRVSDTSPPSNTVAAATADLKFPDTTAWEDELADNGSDTASEKFSDALAYQLSEPDSTTLSSPPEYLLAKSWADLDKPNNHALELYTTDSAIGDSKDENSLQKISPTCPPTNIGETISDDFTTCGIEITPSGRHFISHPKVAGINVTEIDDASIDAIFTALKSIQEVQLAALDPLLSFSSRVDTRDGLKGLSTGRKMLELLLQKRTIQWKTWKLIYLLSAHETSFGNYIKGQVDLLAAQDVRERGGITEPVGWKFFKVLEMIVESGWVKIDGGEF
ncbi:hypothetical protein TWF694_005704 [Orbilia ellipsospora]|uniref:Uncharacterized protein n=1 Tax=Orbilia ellipsospora TaxID=2528407 RepID=A0AAV9WT29_9PEZI